MRRMRLTERFAYACVYAAEVHAGQVRKGSGIPYVSHLLEVAAMVVAHGGNEDEAIAALLHDAPEDAGGLDRLEDIRGRFGARVAGIVDGCTDTYQDPKPAWRARKEAYLARVPGLPDSALLVSAADKVVNVRAVIDDYKVAGEAVWDRFAGGRDTLWYYRAAADAFLSTERTPLVDKLDRLVRELHELVQ
ncbi:MAG: HD domain-containing protein [Acidobacteriota bacterium]